MIKLSKAMYTLKNFIISEKAHEITLNTKYSFKTKLGQLRGIISIIMGRIEYQDEYRPLILGKGIDFHMEKGSSIVLTGQNKISIDEEPANKIHKAATSIGTPPHWNFMNPCANKFTRIRLRKNAKLVIAENTSILIGSYIGVWPNQKLEIGANTNIAHGVFINTKCGLSIGNNVMIAHNASIMDYDGHPVFYSKDERYTLPESERYGGSAKPIVIEDNVWIGFGATILKGCRIGSGSIIAAGACVISDIPPNSIAIGNPARVIQRGNVIWKKY